MTVVVEIPLAYYQAFIGRCYLESREYHVLRNAIIDHVPAHLRDGNVATLLCSEDDARVLLRRAKQFYPIAASYIDEALHSPGYRKARSGDASDSAPPNTKTLGDISLPISRRFACPKMSGYSSSEPSPGVTSVHCIPSTSKRIELFLR